MKKSFYLLGTLSIAAIVIGMFGSCSKINERLDNLEKKIDGAGSDQIAAIKTQIEGIKSSISDLGTIRSSIETLSSEVAAHGGDITELQNADKALGERIDGLTDYVNEVLSSYATKDWCNATFATLEQHQWTCDTIAGIDARIGMLDARIAGEIEGCRTSLQNWVNERLSEYYTAAQMDAKLSVMQSEIDALKGSKDMTRIDSLAAELTKTKAAVDTAKAAIRNEYKAAIRSAIETSEGKLTQALQDSIAKVNSTIAALDTRVGTLEAEVAVLTGRVDDIEKMIQTVTIVPAYSDGSVKAVSGILELNLIVSPAAAAKDLKKENVRILTNNIFTKSVKVDTVKAGNITDFTVDKENGIVEIKADVSDRLPEVPTLMLAVAANICNGISNYTTSFATVTEGDGEDYYVSVDGSGTKSGRNKENAMDTAALNALLTPRPEAELPAQAAALNGATIHFESGIYDLGKLLTMEYGGRRVDIDFQGSDTDTTIFSGGANHRLLVIGNAVKVSFDRIAFRDSRSYISTEPGILLEEGTESRFTNCWITENVNEDADTAGLHHSQAGIKTYGKSYFENCLFARNRASYGASLTLDADATVKNCKFRGNRGIHGPGNSIYVDANCTVKVEDCMFLDNKTELMDGGAVAISTGRLNMENCSFMENSNSGWRGGALYAWNNAKVTLTGCSMTRNTSNFGGAIFTQDKSELEIVGGTYSQNTAKGGGFLYQGGDSKVTIKEGASIESNYATEGHGSAVVMGSDGGSLTCESVTFKNNSNESSGGTVAYGGAVGTTGKGMMTMKNCTFNGNFNKSFGGAAINMNGSGNSLISGCTFTSNQVQCIGIPDGNNNGRYGGGAIRFDSTGNISVEGCTFEGNFFVSKDITDSYNHAYGGAVYINAGGKYTFNNCKFKGNHAVRGGALCVWATGASIYLNACSFDGNFITFRNGTTIHIEKAEEFCMNNCSINDNTWTENGNKGWQASWVNLADIKDICLSNCSFIGSPRTGDSHDISTSDNSIVRFSGIREGKHYFVNNIVVTEGAATCNRAFSNYNTTDNYAYHTKRSDNSASGAGGSYTMLETPGSNGFDKSMFGSLAWDGTDMCWKWNGTMTGGNNTGNADAETAVSHIGQIPGFKSWLEQIGALYKDQLGNARPQTGEWRPGAYQGSQPE